MCFQAPRSAMLYDEMRIRHRLVPFFDRSSIPGVSLPSIACVYSARDLETCERYSRLIVDPKLLQFFEERAER